MAEVQKGCGGRNVQGEGAVGGGGRKAVYDVPQRLLAVQLGNAETSCGVFVEGALAASWTMATHARATSDELENQMRSFFANRQIQQIDQAILCSVVPASTDSWVQALHAVCGARPLVVGPGLKTGLSLGYKDPAQIGADRVVCAVAAKELYGNGTIVVDFGHETTTYSVVDGKGAFAGGVIAPGLSASMDVLGASAAQLVPVNLRMPKSVLGRSTVEAVQAGVVRGEILRTDGFIAALWEELGEETHLVATGRYAQLISRCSAHEFAVEPHLALRGLYRLWCLNSKK